VADSYEKPRRKATRKYLATQCRTNFEYKDKEYRGVLQNVSETGAGFRLEISFDEPDLVVGDLVDFHVSSRYGEGIFKGRVIWTNSVGALYTWGIQFVDLDKTARELVMNLMESTF
jgi:hypothetical protein